MRNRLLVVDGELRGLRVLDVSLRGAGFQVETASDGLEAWASLERNLPDLVVCDVDLPGLDGFGLCARLRRTGAGAAVPFLMTSARKSRDQKIRALEAGADDFLVKPAYVKEVVARIRALLHRRDREALLTHQAPPPEVASLGTAGRIEASSFSGDLADISVVDIVQLIEGNGRSGIVHLRRPGGAPAFLYFRGGKVVDAEAGRLSGLDALSRLFSWTAGSFEIEWKNIRRKDAIERPPSELVLEGMQRLDAWNELRDQLGDPNAVFEVEYRLLAERLAEIPDEVNGILRLCDGVRTVMQVVEESTLPDAEALSALLRLRSEGIVRDKAAARPGDASGSAPHFAGTSSSLGPPLSAVAPERLARPAGSGSAAQSPGGGPPGEPDVRVPAPAVPRRTSPGLGQRAPDETASSEARSPSRPDRALPQDNVIQFPAPGSAAERTRPLSESPHPSRTRVGFEPATLAAAPTPGRPETESLTPPAGVQPPLALPSDAAEEEGLAQDQRVRARDGGENADAGGPPIPTLSVSMADTKRGVGAMPPRPETSGSHTSAVPVEIPESPSRASKPSNGTGPTSAAAGSSIEPPARSARVRISSDEPVAASGIVASDSSAPLSAPRTGSGPRSVPRPGDATVRVSFADGDISRGDALDELGLPARGRGLRVLAGALLFGVLAAVGVTRFVSSRAHTDAVEDQVPAAPEAPSASQPPAAARPTEAVVVPSAPRPTRSTPAPDVELPSAAPLTASTLAKPTAGTAEAPAAASAIAGPPDAAHAATAHPSDGEHAGRGAAATRATSSPVVVPSVAPVPPVVPEKVAPAASEEASPAVTAASQLATCRTAFAKNRLREAMAACTAAAAANPRSAEVLTMLAHTELNRGNLERANDLAERAVALDPNLADAYVIIGGVHQDSGQNKEAKAAYRRYLELSPRGRYADELRSIVNRL